MSHVWTSAYSKQSACRNFLTKSILIKDLTPCIPSRPEITRIKHFFEPRLSREWSVFKYFSNHYLTKRTGTNIPHRRLVTVFGEPRRLYKDFYKVHCRTSLVEHLKGRVPLCSQGMNLHYRTSNSTTAGYTTDVQSSSNWKVGIVEEAAMGVRRERCVRSGACKLRIGWWLIGWDEWKHIFTQISIPYVELATTVSTSSLIGWSHWQCLHYFVKNEQFLLLWKKERKILKCYHFVT